MQLINGIEWMLILRNPNRDRALKTENYIIQRLFIISIEQNTFFFSIKQQIVLLH